MTNNDIRTSELIKEHAEFIEQLSAEMIVKEIPNANAINLHSKRILAAINAMKPERTVKKLDLLGNNKEVK